MAEERPLLVIDDVTVHRGAVTAVSGVSLGVPAGPPFALVGESGSGKTTLLMAVAGLLPCASGRVTVDLVDVRALDGRKRARTMGLVFQDHQLFPHLTALENVGLAPTLHGDADAADRARASLGRLGLGGLEGRLPHELSGGQKQRVAIARALVLRPRVLLFDEPSAALDPRTAAELADLLVALADETLVVVVSHDAPFVVRCAMRGARMDRGKLVAEGAPRALFESP